MSRVDFVCFVVWLFIAAAVVAEVVTIGYFVWKWVL